MAIDARLRKRRKRKMPEINVELLRLGIAALRSGKFKKGAGRLHKIVGDEPGPDDEYCCLGVLSAVAAENGCPVTREIVAVAESYLREVFGSRGAEYLSVEVMACYGFDTVNPILLTPDGRRVSASAWNDRGYDYNLPLEEDFGPIADAFERTFLPAT